jgi:alpha-tubulin suppressor-like RCC1 family protein
MTTGGLRCWGLNNRGQLGDGSTIDRNTPPATDILTDVQGVATGSNHTCALTKAGGVRCWGQFDMLGNPNLVADDTLGIAVTRPPTEDVLTDVQSIATDSDYTCALTNARGVRCWGYYTNDRFSIDPHVVSDDLITGVRAIDVGGGNTCVIMTTGGLRCWGNNSYGHLGNGSTLDTSPETARQTEILPNVQSVSMGGYWFVCAVTLEGRIQCWGFNGEGQLGDTSPYVPMNIYGTNSAYTTTPSPEFFSGVQSLATGMAHTCALTTAGGVRCWGDDQFGQLGDGAVRTEGTHLVPSADVISGVKAIAAGGSQTCVITNAGGLRCWGDNTYGQLGNGKSYPPQTNIPVHVVGTCD